MTSVITGVMTDTGDFYMVAITALLPLMAVLLVLQVNPYQALVIRGILGAIAALVYALLGAADVALTEALVGTMLSITLYAVAVRSSMAMRIGVIVASHDSSHDSQSPSSDKSVSPSLPKPLLSALEEVLNKHHLRTEILTYPDAHTMTSALKAKEIHACYSFASRSSGLQDGSLGSLQTRVRRLYDILQSGLPSDVKLSYLEIAAIELVVDADRLKGKQSNFVGKSR